MGNLFQLKSVRLLILPAFLTCFCLLSSMSPLEATPPEVVGVDPSAGTSAPGETVNFTTIFRDPDGAQNIQTALFAAVGFSEAGETLLMGLYVEDFNVVYLFDEETESWVGGETPGSSGNIVTGHGVLNLGQMIVTATGDTLSIQWPLAFTQSFSGLKTLFLYAQDEQGETTAVSHEGSWIINSPPEMSTITPINAGALAGEEVVFEIISRDPDGASNLEWSIFAAIGFMPEGDQFFMTLYHEAANILYLYDQASNEWLGGIAPGTETELETAFGSLNVAGVTITHNVDALEIALPVTFSPAFSGEKLLFQLAQDDFGAGNGFQFLGTWTIVDTLPVRVVDTFDGDSAVDFSWDIDGSIVYERHISDAYAFDGRSAMEVIYHKTPFAPQSFFAFHLDPAHQNISGYEELRMRVRVNEGSSIQLAAKVEGPGNVIWQETQTASAGGVWAELVYDLSTATFPLDQVENIFWLVNPGDGVSAGTFYIDHVMLISTDHAFVTTPAAPMLQGPSQAAGQYTLMWNDAAESGGVLYKLLEDDQAGFSSPTIFYSSKLDQLIPAPEQAGTWFYQLYALSGHESQPATRLSLPSNVLQVDVQSGPPVIEVVDSFSGDDTDAIYKAGSLVRINVLELYRAENVVSGTVRVSSVSTGYDSGLLQLAHDPAAESWFCHWVTNDLEAADDYVVAATLTNDLGLIDADGSDDDPDHQISLTLEPPLVKDLFTVHEFSVPAQGPDVTFARTYKASTLYEGVMGWGWFHNYEIRLLDFQDGSVVVEDGPRGEWLYFPDGSGGFTASKPNNHAELFQEGSGWRLRFKDGLTYHFNAEGQLVEMTDRNSNALTFAYTPEGLLDSVTDASNQVTTFGYTLLSGGTWRLTDVTDPFGRTWYFVYHPDHALFAVEDPAGKAENYFYSGNHDLTIRADRSGVQTFYNYFGDEKRRLKSRNIPGDIDRVDYTYGPGAEIRMKDALNRITLRKYSASGLLLEEVDPLLNVTMYEYDEDRNVTRMTDALQHETEMTYDDRGNLLTITDPLDRTSSFTYESVFHQVTSSTDPRMETTLFRYDSRGNLVEIEDPLGNIRSFTYDTAGNLLSASDPLTHETVFTYTAQGLVETVTDPLDRVRSFVYDARGNVIREMDPDGQSTLFTYDVLNRVISTTDRVGAMTKFQYTATGKIRFMWDHFDRRTDHSYDVAERLIERKYPDNSRETFQYDLVGNTTNTRDRNGKSIFYSYDALNRLKTKTYQGGGVDAFYYDALGRLTFVYSAEAGIFRFSYDDAGQLITTWMDEPVVRTFSFEYDAAGNRTGMIDHEGRLLTTTYDAAGRVDTIDRAGRLFDYDYDEVSRMVQKTFPNEVEMHFAYDAADQLTGITNENLTAGADHDFSFQYNNLGNATQKVSSATGTFSYDYDAAEQLTSETHPLSGLFSTSYDLLGNRLMSAGISYVTNFLNQYTQAGSETFTYDFAGRVVMRAAPSAGTTGYTYTPEGRLKETTRPDGSVVRFAYDPFGRKHSRTVMSGGDTERTYFLYDGDQLIAELDETGYERRSYLYGIATDELLMQTEAGSVSYALHDHQYSVTGLFNETGTVLEAYTYDAFGNATDGIVERLTPIGYTGRYWEKEINLYDYRARMYDPTLGRFLQPDPALFIDGPNLYTYVTNNPVNYRDPSGLCIDCDDEPVPDDDLEDFFSRQLQEQLLRLLEQLLQLLQQLHANANVSAAYSGSFTGPFGFGGFVEVSRSRDGVDLTLGAGLGLGSGVSGGLGTSIGDSGPVGGFISASGGASGRIGGAVSGSVGGGGFSGSAIIGGGFGAGVSGGVYARVPPFKFRRE